MRILSTAIFSAALILVMGGCASTGPAISNAQLAELQKGKTTADDVVRRFGKPSFNSDNLDGTRTAGYLQEGTRSDASAMVALIGAIAGGTGSNVSVNSVIFRFDTKGVLSSYERTSESQTAVSEAVPPATAAAASGSATAAAGTAAQPAATRSSAPAAATAPAAAAAAAKPAPRADNLPSWMPTREGRDSLNAAH